MNIVRNQRVVVTFSVDELDRLNKYYLPLGWTSIAHMLRTKTLMDLVELEEPTPQLKATKPSTTKLVPFDPVNPAHILKKLGIPADDNEE